MLSKHQTKCTQRQQLKKPWENNCTNCYLFLYRINQFVNLFKATNKTYQFIVSATTSVFASKTSKTVRLRIYVNKQQLQQICKMSFVSHVIFHRYLFFIFVRKKLKHISSFLPLFFKCRKLIYITEGWMTTFVSAFFRIHNISKTVYVSQQ